MSSLHRLATSTLTEAAPRKFPSASFRHSIVLSSSALSTEFLGVPEKFDISDNRVKLRETNTPNVPSKVFKSRSTVRVTSRAGSSKGMHNDALGLPWSLPPPVVFDGPAHPPHMSPSTLTKFRLQRQNFPRFPYGDRGSSAASCSALRSQSETLCQLFDGPARVTRSQYPPSENERYSWTYISSALCFSTVFGWLALKENMEQNNERSL